MALVIDRGHLLAFALVYCVPLCGPAWAGKDADLILTNGHVYTADPKSRWAEAVAVKDGKIIYVGSTADAKTKHGPNTKEVDLAGRLLLPGFNDPHDHMDRFTQKRLWANLGSKGTTHTLESYRQTISEYRAKHPDLKQLRGFGFDKWILPAIAKSLKRPPRELLDEMVSDVPALILSWQGHDGWANSKALELAGITKDTPNPSLIPGTGFELDPTSGEPNGMIHEDGAWNLILAKFPEDPDFNVEQYRTGILDFQREMAAPRGITGLLLPTDFRTETLPAAFQRLSDEGLLTMHYSVAQWADDQLGIEAVPELIARRAKFHGGPYFRFNTIKIFLPWSHPPSEVNRTFAALDKAGFQIYTHITAAPGPEGWARGLDAFEYTLKQNGPRDSRHVITHHRPQMIPLVPRFKALSLRVDVDWQPTPIYYLPLKAFIEAGVPMELSSDYPASDPSPLPWIAECAKRGLPLEPVIDSVTIRPAETEFADKVTGSITVGKAADLIVLDRDLFKVSPEQIGGAKVLLTLFAGKELYRDPSF